MRLRAQPESRVSVDESRSLRALVMVAGAIGMALSGVMPPAFGASSTTDAAVAGSLAAALTTGAAEGHRARNQRCDRTRHLPVRRARASSRRRRPAAGW